MTGIPIRAAETDADLEAWRRARMAVLPNESCASVEWMRASMTPSVYAGGERLEREPDMRRAPRTRSPPCSAGGAGGIATVPKEATLAFAAEQGIDLVYTWTQRRNEAMRRHDERLGYVYGTESITVRAPRPRP